MCQLLVRPNKRCCRRYRGWDSLHFVPAVPKLGVKRKGIMFGEMVFGAVMVFAVFYLSSFQQGKRGEELRSDPNGTGV